MLNNLQQIESHDYSGKFFMGVVVANDDPEQMERVKVRVPNLYDAETDLLPWVAPFKMGVIPNHPEGTYGSFGLVPPVGSILFILLQEGNPQYPVYLGSLVVQGGHVAEGNTGYPNRYGFKDPAGNLVYVDTSSGSNTINIEHASGATVQIADDGSINVNSPADMNFTADGGINMTATGDVRIIGAQVHLNPT